jgi:pimeloyl-ACP methyl ester carboxylesterase
LTLPVRDSATGMKSISPKLLANIGGNIFEYVTAGSGLPTIVLVNGSGGPIEGWYKIFASLAESGTVFAYNRLGIGGSSKPAAPQTGDVMVSSLRALLRQAKLPLPYLLVGHSLGGLIVNLFARSFPGEVSAVVLLDATAPEDIGVMAKYQSAVQRVVQKTLDTVLGKNEFSETEHAARTVELIDRAGPFPAIPLIVVTGGKLAMPWATAAPALAARAKHQRKLADLSPKGKQIIARQSGHFPQFTEPDVVLDAVREAMSLPVQA